MFMVKYSRVYSEELISHFLLTPVFPEAPTAVSFLGGFPEMFHIYIGI